MKIFLRTLLLIFVVAILHFAGVYFGIYEHQIQQGVVWFDNILHVLDGAIFAYAWISYKKDKGLPISLVGPIIFVLILAVGWEILEYGIMKLFPLHAIDLKIYSPSLWEAFQDIVSNTVGALILVLISLRRK